ncbi:hypothetical protein BDQ17DRAFT_1347735 [Cyathus striatus]|nr:hypothetical protein BDQ17DRAFT_1347735 [Cyathus striatus]
MAAELPSDSRKPRTSFAIQHGADLIITLIEEEKAKLALQYKQKIRELERHITPYHLYAETDKSVLENVIGIEDELQKCKADVTRLQMDALIMRQEADQANKQTATLNNELNMLKNSLDGMGMVYSNGSITFKAEAARAAAKVINDAQFQRKAIHDADAISRIAGGDEPVSFSKPSEFLGVFQVLMERDRRLVEMIMAKCRNVEEERKRLLDSQQNQRVLLQNFIEKLENEVFWRDTGSSTHDHDVIAEIFSSIKQILGEHSNITRNANDQSGDH